MWTPWLRHARAHLRHLFPYPRQPGYNKRLHKAAGLMRSVNRIPASTTSVWSDDATGHTVLRTLIAYDH